MQRRQFFRSSLAGSVSLAAAAGLDAQTSSSREYYELRCYRLQSGEQPKLTDKYLAEALIPGLNKLGIKNVGAFSLYLGPETPATYVLIPSTSVETLVSADFLLEKDDDYRKAAEAFMTAPAKSPAFLRMESSLMIAFEGYPRLTPPPVSAQHGARVFQLRTYESPNQADHRRKVEMFHGGEFDIFAKAGFWNVFFGDTLIGARLPNLTYMLSFPDLAELDAKWKNFLTHPDWKKLSADPRFTYEAIVSSITNLILRPTSYSQI